MFAKYESLSSRPRICATIAFSGISTTTFGSCKYSCVHTPSSHISKSSTAHDYAWLNMKGVVDFDLFIVLLLTVNTSWTAAGSALQHSVNASKDHARTDVADPALSSAHTTTSISSHLTQTPYRLLSQHLSTRPWTSRKLETVADRNVKDSAASRAGFGDDFPPHVLLKDLSLGFSPVAPSMPSATTTHTGGARASSIENGASADLTGGRRKLKSTTSHGGCNTICTTPCLDASIVCPYGRFGQQSQCLVLFALRMCMHALAHAYFTTSNENTICALG